MTEIVLCDNCNRHFPFNSRKHQFDKYIYCPSCKTKIRNPSKIPTLRLSDIHFALGKDATNESILVEVEGLQKIGVRIKGEFQ